MEKAIKSINASSERAVDGVEPDPDQWNFSGQIEGLQMTASSRINLNRDLNKTDETRGNITVEAGDLPVNERNFDRQTHTRHNMFMQKLEKRLKSSFDLDCENVL